MMQWSILGCRRLVYGPVDFAEVCCTSDGLLSGAVTSLGGHAVQYSHWNGFDLTTKARTDKLKEDFLERKPRAVWMTPPCTTQRSQQSQSRSRFHRVQMNILAVFLWLVKKDWCESILKDDLSRKTRTQTHHCCSQKVQLQWVRRKSETKVTSGSS